MNQFRIELNGKATSGSPKEVAARAMQIIARYVRDDGAVDIDDTPSLFEELEAAGFRATTADVLTAA
jgi:hypothetical protein